MGELPPSSLGITEGTVSAAPELIAGTMFQALSVKTVLVSALSAPADGSLNIVTLPVSS